MLGNDPEDSQRIRSGVSLSKHIPEKYWRGVFPEDMLVKQSIGANALRNLNGAKAVDRLERILNLENLASELRFNLEIEEETGSLVTFIRRSAFSHLLLLDYLLLEKLYPDKPEEAFNHLIKKIKCPVLLIPLKKVDCKHLIFLFDGSDSSIASIKNFIKIFDQALNWQALTILALTPNGETDIVNERLLVDFIRLNFTNVGIQITDRDNFMKNLVNLSLSEQHSMIISGAQTVDLLNAENFFYLTYKRKYPLFYSHC